MTPLSMDPSSPPQKPYTPLMSVAESAAFKGPGIFAQSKAVAPLENAFP